MNIISENRKLGLSDVLNAPTASSKFSFGSEVSSVNRTLIELGAYWSFG